MKNKLEDINTKYMFNNGDNFAWTVADLIEEGLEGYTEDEVDVIVGFLKVVLHRAESE